MIGVITGLAAEASLLAALNWQTAAGGGTPEGAEQAAESLISQGATALISFGLAGGLDPTFAPGDLILPAGIEDDGQTYRCDPTLITLLGGHANGKLLAGKTIAATIAEKHTLWTTTACTAIDLESGATARVAQRHNLPFAVLRAICDPADRTLPKAALIPLKPGGGINLSRILASVATNPAQIPGLIAVGRDAARARAALVSRVNEIRIRLG
jgi:adenosylhomocysteine nucleosidase